MMKKLFLHQAVRLAFHALSSLVAHHIALVLELPGIEFFQEKSHAVAFEPEGQLQLVRRQRFKIIRAVKVCCAVDLAGSRRLEVPEVALFADVPGSLEHHVFEQVSEAGEAGALIGRADVIPDIHGHERQTVVLEQNHIEAVGESVFFVVEFGHWMVGRHEISFTPRGPRRSLKVANITFGKSHN